MLVLVPISAYKPQGRPQRQQPPEDRAIQISFDGLRSQGKSGEWQLMNEEAAYRTAPATPGLLNIQATDTVPYKPQFLKVTVSLSCDGAKIF